MSSNKKKYKYLAKNIGLLTLSSFATKILTFFLVPLYTNILSTTEYGINDLFMTTIGIILPVITINIQESVMRFSMDSKYKKNEVISVGIRYLIGSSFVVLLALLINHVFTIFELFNTYGTFFFLMFFAQALSGIMVSYCRGMDRIKDLSFSSIVCSAVTIIFNITFLVYFKLGIIGYFLACILGPLVQSLYLFFRLSVCKDITLIHVNRKLLKEMSEYSRPMIANAIGWWINNAADKYIVIFFAGIASNGIYAVASKISAILNVIQSIFAQAWTISVVKDYDPEDGDGFFSKTYAVYNCLMTLGCAWIIFGDKLLAHVLFAKEFYAAWRYVPFLTIAIVFGSLSGYVGGFFTAVKNSKIYGQSTLVGAICNIIMNFIFIPLMGVIGAALATAISYMIVWFFRLIHSKRYIKLNINIKRDCISYIFLVLQAVALLYIRDKYLYYIEATLVIMQFLLYRKEIVLVLDRLRDLVKTRKNNE